MILIRNSAKCNSCDEELESHHRHDFNVHYCKANPKQALEWRGTGVEAVLGDVPGETTFNFGVDGGLAYIRRIGSGYTDTSVYENE